MATTTELAERLTQGWIVCDRAPPDKLYAYEDHWIALLRLYEAAAIREGLTTHDLRPLRDNIQPTTEQGEETQSMLLLG